MKVELQITRKVLFEKYSLQQDMEGFFTFMLEGCEIKKLEKEKYSIFYVKNDLILFEIVIDENDETNYHSFVVRNDLIWSVFIEKYKLSFEHTYDYISIFLKMYLRIEVCSILCNMHHFSLEKFSYQMIQEV